MMYIRTIIAVICLFFLTANLCIGQVKLSSNDLNNLVAIAQIYSQNPNVSGDESVRSINNLRTPRLNNLADVLITAGKGDADILDSRFLKRPSDDELYLWFVLREIHYNRVSTTRPARPDYVVASEVLAKTIDSRLLLDNYYYRIHGGIASLFNTADLSKIDLKVDEYGFRDETEKAIFFFNMIDSMVGGRFKVLLMMRNHQKISEFGRKLPKFNGKDYFYYKNFAYPDFDWIGYEKTESYNERHIGNLYVVLFAQSQAMAEIGDKRTAERITINSILNEPKYFKFSELKDLLQKRYDSAK